MSSPQNHTTILRRRNLDVSLDLENIQMCWGFFKVGQLVNKFTHRVSSFYLLTRCTAENIVWRRFRLVESVARWKMFQKLPYFAEILMSMRRIKWTNVRRYYSVVNRFKCQYARKWNMPESEFAKSAGGKFSARNMRSSKWLK